MKRSIALDGNSEFRRTNWFPDGAASLLGELQSGYWASRKDRSSIGSFGHCQFNRSVTKQPLSQSIIAEQFSFKYFGQAKINNLEAV
jgi:hypothetical protein